MYQHGLGALTGWVAAILLTISQLAKGESACGGYYDVSKYAYSTGTLSSPNYPAAYSPRTDCIWLVYGPALRTLSLNILTLDGETNKGACLDYLEVTAGSSSALQLFTGCSTGANITIETPNRWLWVRFHSDEAVAGKGFLGVWETTDNIANASFSGDPVKKCPSTRFTCLNKECVSYAWTCDGFNDCGCTESGCDENPCIKSTLTNPIRLAIGVSAGVFLTIFCIVVTMWSEFVNPWPPFKKKAKEPQKKDKKSKK